MPPRLRPIVTALLSGLALATVVAAAPTPIEFNPAALQVDEALLERNRPDLVLLLDCLRRECEKAPEQFAAADATYRQAITDYHATIRAAGPEPGRQLAAAKQFLSTKFSYEPPGALALAVHALADTAALDAMRHMRRISPGLESAWDPARDGFVGQLRAVHRVCEVAGVQPALRNLLDDTITRAGGEAFRFAGEAAQWTDRWNTLRSLLAGGGDAAVREALRGAQADYLPLVTEASRLEQEMVATFERLKATTPDPDDFRRALSRVRLTVQADAQRAERVFRTQACLGLAAELANLGGDRRLANQIAQVSEFYAKTEGFLKTMSVLSSRGMDFKNSLLMTTATLNYVNLTLTVFSMLEGGGADGQADTNRLILEELAAVRRQLVELGRSMHRRFDLIDFRLAEGFGQTLEALAILRAEQQLTAANVRALADRLAAFQHQTAGLLDRTGGLLSDLDWRRFVDAANRPEWSDDIARTFDDLVTLVADNSRDRVESSEFDPTTAGVEMVATFGGLTHGRLTAQALGNYRVFAKGNFLRGYFESRHRTILSPPATGVGVPNLFVWLRGVGLLGQMQAKFPQLAGRLTAPQQKRIATALDDVEGFWRNLASAKVGGGTAGFTYEASLFEGTLNTLSEDLRAIQRLVRLERPAFAGGNGGIDCWDYASLEEGSAPAQWFRLSQDEIRSKDGGADRLAAYDRSHGVWAAADEWRATLPERLAWGGGEFFDRFFLPTERAGHSLSLPNGRLSVRLHSHGWSYLGNRAPGSGLGRTPGVWRLEFGLYRGTELLRVLNIVRTDGTYGELVPAPSPGAGFNAPRYVVNFDDATATAERIWREATQCPLAAPERRTRLMANVRAALAGGMWQPALESEGGWNFSLQEAVGTVSEHESTRAAYQNGQFTQQALMNQLTKINEREDRCSNEVTEAFNAAQRRFLTQRLPQVAALKALIEKYDEDRVALLVLMNFAAPESLRPRGRLYSMFYENKSVPAGWNVVDYSICTGGDDYIGRPDWINFLENGIKEEFRLGRFPQIPDYVTYARYFMTARAHER